MRSVLLSIKATDKLNQLNERVIGKIKERLKDNNTDRMAKMEVQFRELIDDDETTLVNPMRH